MGSIKTREKTKMKKIPLIARILLGLVFFVFGLNGFLQFLPVPPMPAGAAAFATGLMGSGYFFPFLKALETLSGLLLLSGFFVPLALVVLAPIIAHIFLFHAFLEPSGVPIALVIGALEIYLAFFAEPYKNTIRPLFRK
jgi:putative oxidoreductase